MTFSASIWRTDQKEILEQLESSKRGEITEVSEEPLMSARIHVVSQSTAKSLLATARQPAAFDMLLPWKPSETPKVLQASERSVRDPMGASCISAQHSPGKFPLSKKSSNNTSAGAESAPENQPPSRQQAVVCKASRAGPAFCSCSTIMAGGPRPAQQKGPTCKGKKALGDQAWCWSSVCLGLLQRRALSRRKLEPAGYPRANEVATSDARSLF